MLNNYFDKVKSYFKEHKYLALVAIVLLGLLVLSIVRSLLTKNTAKQKVMKPMVNTVVLKKEPMYKELRLIGKTVPLARVDIVAKYGGAVKEVKVQLGDVVKQGQLLLLQDQEYAQAEVDRYKAYYEESRATAKKTTAEYTNDYNRYKADYQIALSNYERYAKLYEKGAVSRYELDAIQQKLNSAKAAYQELEEQQGYADNSSAAVYAKEQVAMRRLGDYRMRLAKLKDLEFYAPRAGVISYRHAEEGSYVTAGTRMLSITDNSSLYVDCSVPEYDAAILQEGIELEVELESLGLKVPATLLYVSPDQGGEGKSFQVRLKLKNTSKNLKSGLLARAQLKQQQREAALAVKKELVLENKGRYYVFCLDKNNKVEQKYVKIGLRNDQQLEIVEGLQEGDRLIVDNLSRLKKGLSVDVAVGDK